MENKETKSLPAMSTKEIDVAIEKIRGAINKASSAYISIVGTVAKLKDTKAYEVKGYKNIYDMTAELFEMSRGTTSNLVMINRRFCENYKLLDEYKSLSMREMLRIIADEKAQIQDNSADSTALEDKSQDSIRNAESNEKEATSGTNTGDIVPDGIFEKEFNVESSESVDDFCEQLSGMLLEGLEKKGTIKIKVEVK